MEDAVLIEASMAMAGMAVILIAFASVLTGQAAVIGEAVRLQLAPVLRSVRESSQLSRSDLADRSILVAAVLSLVSYFVDQRSVLTLLIAMAMVWARPIVQDLSREENELRALAGQISSDLVAGLYTMIAFAQVLFGFYVQAVSFMAVVVALSWPTKSTALSRWQR